VWLSNSRVVMGHCFRGNGNDAVRHRDRDGHSRDLLLVHGAGDDLVHLAAEIRGRASLSGRRRSDLEENDNQAAEFH
jgi:hypothetical protein